LFREFISGLFNSPEPRLHSHELISLISIFVKILDNDFLFSLSLLNYSAWNINIVVIIRKTIRLLSVFIIFIIIIFIFWTAQIFPHYDSLILTAQRYHVILTEFNASYMRTVAVKGLEFLFWDVAWIFKESDYLVIVSYSQKL